MSPAGRPEIGQPINVRLGDDLLARVDVWRLSGPVQVSRASAVRSMVAAALAELDDETIGGY